MPRRGRGAITAIEFRIPTETDRDSEDGDDDYDDCDDNEDDHDDDVKDEDEDEEEDDDSYSPYVNLADIENMEDLTNWLFVHQKSVLSTTTHCRNDLPPAMRAKVDSHARNSHVLSATYQRIYREEGRTSKKRAARIPGFLNRNHCSPWN